MAASRAPVSPSVCCVVRLVCGPAPVRPSVCCVVRLVCGPAPVRPAGVWRRRGGPRTKLNRRAHSCARAVCCWGDFDELKPALAPSARLLRGLVSSGVAHFVRELRAPVRAQLLTLAILCAVWNRCSPWAITGRFISAWSRRRLSLFQNERQTSGKLELSGRAPSLMTALAFGLTFSALAALFTSRHIANSKTGPCNATCFTRSDIGAWLTMAVVPQPVSRKMPSAAVNLFSFVVLIICLPPNGCLVIL